jgi:photosystem II stability/assembly factor-like uncharacterized protein
VRSIGPPIWLLLCALLVGGLLARPPAAAQRSVRLNLPIVPLRWDAARPASVWRWQNRPPLGGRDLTAVAFAGHDVGWAVGEVGAITGTTDGGRTWVDQVSGIDARLTAVAAGSPTTAWAVGEGGVIVGTRDGGATWHRQASGTDAALRGVAAASPTDAWAVGDGGRILRTTDGGATWVAVESGTSWRLSAISASSPRVLWAVGSEPTFGVPDGVILRSVDGGATWATQWIGREELFAVHALSPSVVWATGYDDNFHGRTSGMVLTTVDGGTTWTKRSNVGGYGYMALTGVSLATPAIGWVVGRQSDGSMTEGLILKTTDGGATWTEQTRPPNPAAAVVALSPLDARVVGEDAMVLRTVDGGQTWSYATDPGPPPAELSAVSFADEANGWAIGPSAMLHTTDGGITWTSQPSGRGLYVAAASPTDAWAATDGAIARTSDGGRTWLTQDTSSVTDPDRPILHLMGLAAGSPRRAWAIGQICGAQPLCLRVILRTDDGGATWSRVVSPNVALLSIAAVSPTVVWIGAQEGGERAALLHTADGGLTWQVVYPEGVPGFHPLYSIAAPSPEVVWLIGFGTVVRTTDGGRTWRTVGRDGQPPTPGGSPSPTIAAASDRVAWVSSGGDIWATTDGGENWTRQWVAPRPTHLRLHALSPSAAWAVGTDGSILRAAPY